ncbi:MAG TPA: jacalin-like lectin [Anaerolineales bacterium]|nr:jacalin-like lectin [Anaerolineales bacterium]
MSEKQYGPIGGLSGKQVPVHSIPVGARLVEVRVFAAQYIDAIQFIYETADGKRETLPWMGGLGGQMYVFELQPDEYLTAISGAADWYLDSVRFHTNLRHSPLYGGFGGDEFTLLAPAGEHIVGIFGRADWYIDSIGIITRPLT